MIPRLNEDHPISGCGLEICDWRAMFIIEIRPEFEASDADDAMKMDNNVSNSFYDSMPVMAPSWADSWKQQCKPSHKETNC